MFILWGVVLNCVADVESRTCIYSVEVAGTGLGDMARVSYYTPKQAVINKLSHYVRSHGRCRKNASSHHCAQRTFYASILRLSSELL